MKKITPLVISILLHLAVLLVALNTPISKKKVHSPKIFIELIDVTENKKMTVFDNQAKETEKPKNAEFYGKKNSKVKKQTIAKNKESKVKINKPKRKKNKKLTLEDLRPKPMDLSGIKYSERIKEEESRKYPDGAVLNLADFKDKIEKGGENLLNTQELVYFSFYERIRYMLVPRWIGLMDEYKYSKGLYVAENSRVHSEVTVKVDKKGRILGAELTKSSNHSPADKMAMEAFSSVQMIPNPPEGVFEGKEYLYITWGFTIFRN